MIGQLAEAGQAGFLVGRARRNPTPDELYRFRSGEQRATFYRGMRRGWKAAAHLDQLRLELEAVGA